MKNYLAVDIGGSYIRYIAVIEEDEFRGKAITKNIDIVSFLSVLIERYGIEKMVVSLAGQVFDGFIIASPNVDITNSFDFSGYFRSKYNIEVMLENDLNCAAVAEAGYFDAENIAVVYSGSGIGAGVVDNGKIIRGFRNLALELGHIPYKKAPFRCGCGKNNCLELFASSSGIKKWLKLKGADEGFTLNEISLDPELKWIADQYKEALVFGVSVVITLFNPEVVVLGGGIIKSNEWLLNYVKQKLPEFALNVSLEGVNIEISQLEDGSLEGARILAEGRFDES
ncbi:ROK family protein [Hippea maritima]|uniref:ROK family protein n=1 Tax=Hippea maritima (strain ATCC 700847 / DSM 10411 / MH2) TaxID=760142 RepID=F2LVZ0_HIPMA|nr:ROK family protein [Hippea maritima]AEA33924.1 ROK family protein [Hippea maritima DSM 10411]